MDRQFPNWEQLYSEQAVESMPWFHEALDPDLERALHQLNVTQGTALDIGTGPGTQAHRKADLCEIAIGRAFKSFFMGLVFPREGDHFIGKFESFNLLLKQYKDFL